ncbi:MAG: hypothetical protein ACRD17_11485 [Terriglobales bacterium]
MIGTAPPTIALLGDCQRCGKVVNRNRQQSSPRDVAWWAHAECVRSAGRPAHDALGVIGEAVAVFMTHRAGAPWFGPCEELAGGLASEVPALAALDACTLAAYLRIPELNLGSHNVRAQIFQTRPDILSTGIKVRLECAGALFRPNAMPNSRTTA